MRLRRAVVALGLALTIGAIVPALLHARASLAGSNTRVIRGAVVLTIPPGAERCQSGEFLPADATSVALAPHTAGVPFGLTFTGADGRTLARATSRGGRVAGAFTRVPLAGHRAADAYPVRLCVRNRGTAELGLEGNLLSTNPEAPPAENGPYQRTTDEVRVDYLEAGRHAPIAQAGRIADRFALFRPDFVGPWTMWAALALFAAVAAYAIRTLLRGLPAA